MMLPPYPVIEWASKEVHRQNASALRVPGMLAAWDSLMNITMANQFDTVLLHRMNGQIIGSVVRHYRTTEVVISTGGDTTHPAHVKLMMGQWISDFRKDRFGGTFETAHIDGIVKRFLDIHPYEDGNGRIGSILYNYLHGSMHYPVMLPDYYQSLDPAG